MLFNLTCSATVVVLVAAVLSAQNQALSLPGTGGAVVVPNDAALVPTTGLTVEAWIYFDPPATGIPNSQAVVVAKHPVASNQSYVLGRSSSAMTFTVRTSTGTTSVGYGSVAFSQWHHVAGTYDGSFVRTYLNGNLLFQQPRTGAIIPTSGDLFIGAANSALADYWQGRIDEVRIWSVARTAGEIQSTMSLPILADPQLLAAWHFDGNFFDSAGFRQGTPFGTATFTGSSVAQSPFINAPASRSIGTTLGYSLFGLIPFAPYALEISFSGASPGTLLPDNRLVPLNPPYVFHQFGGAYPSLFSGFFGFMDSAAHAFPNFAIPLEPGLIGQKINAAFVILDASAPYSIDRISLGRTTTIVDLQLEVLSVVPSVGVPAGGTAVTITGTNFQPGAQVLFGTVPAQNVVVVNLYQITCTSPGGSVGAVPVTVVNPDTQSAFLAAGFAYTAPPVINNVIPPASAVPGVTISLIGNGFQQGLTLTVGGVSIVPNVVTSNVVSYANPPGVGCAAPIVITNPTGQSVTATFNPMPTINALNPSSGSSAGGNIVLISGTNLTGASVTVGGVPVALTLQTPTVLRYTAPAHAPGVVPVVVTTPGGCVTAANYTYL